MTTQTSTSGSSTSTTPAGASGTPTPGQGAPGAAGTSPGESSGQGTAQGTPAKPAGPDRKSLEAAVRRTVALKQKEAEVSKQAEALKPLQELAELVKTNPAAAFRKLAGDDRLLDVYRAVTDDVVGVQGEEKALEALPKSVREQLAKVADLEKRAALVDELQKRLDGLEGAKTEAESKLLERQKTEAATRVYSAGYEAVKAAAADLPLVLAHPRGEELVQTKWTSLLEQKKTELARMDGQERQKFAVELVVEAARNVQAELDESSGWLLQTDWARSKMGGVKGTPPKSKPSAPSKSSATSTPGQQQKKPRTGTPGSLGEPGGTDLRKLTLQQRIRLLKEQEQAGTLYSR